MKIEGNLSEARFIKRLNRFDAIIEIDGAEHHAHVPNTGRLRELFLEGAELIVRRYSNPNRKTQFGLLLVKKDGMWVSIDSSNAPNGIVFEMLQRGGFEQFLGYDVLRREVPVAGSRFDFALFSENHDCYIEVKGVTLVEDRQARFPDAPTTRGTRHLQELTELKLAGKRTAVIFVIQRDDADRIIPNDASDKAFGDALRAAEEAGVELYAYTCRIDLDQRMIDIDRQVPVITHPPSCKL